MLLFCDSFDHYATAELYEKYLGTSVASIVPGAGRNGTSALMLGYSNGYVSKAFANASTLIVGFAVNPPIQQRCDVVLFYDNGTLQGSLRLNPAGGVEYHTYQGNNDTLVAQSPNGIISLNTFQYLEVSVTFSTTATGAVSAQLNGQSIFSVTGIVTSQTADNYANTVSVANGGGSVVNYLFDDLYMCNGAGTVNNSFLGDVAVECLFPNGAGQFTQFTPHGQPQNWQCVSQNPPNGDSDYVSSSTVGNTDFYTIQSIPGTPSAVVAVQIVASARKDDSFTRVLGIGFGNGTTSVFNSGSSLGSNYIMYTQPYDTNPITGLSWDVTHVDNGQIGIQVIS